ncbi:MAG: ABC transporter ATP-binding protein [Nanoarchaeota archaeon]|nr:ABC transporter ATP-binding protein [Nanoarchaeota archaeon]
MLKIKNLHSGYENLEVLKGIDLIVKDKEIVSLIGPNGAGKSTILKSIFGIANILSGEIHYNNKKIRKSKTHELISHGISYVPQGRIVFGDLTIEENLEFGGRLLRDKKLVRNRIEEIYLKFPILKKRKNKLAYTLSGGERQLLAISRALISKPELLMLDEPSLGLSPKIQKQIFSIIQDLKKEGISILIVEQNAKKAIEISDKTYLLENGSIALEGGKDIIRNKKIKKVYLGE